MYCTKCVYPLPGRNVAKSDNETLLIPWPNRAFQPAFSIADSRNFQPLLPSPPPSSSLSIDNPDHSVKPALSSFSFKLSTGTCNFRRLPAPFTHLSHFLPFAPPSDAFWAALPDSSLHPSNPPTAPWVFRLLSMGTRQIHYSSPIQFSKLLTIVYPNSPRRPFDHAVDDRRLIRVSPSQRHLPRDSGVFDFTSR
jgi:hypothetical protein